MGERLDFTAENYPSAYKLYEALAQHGVSLTELDHGYHKINRGGMYCREADTTSCLLGKEDGVVTVEEVWDYALERWQQYQVVIEGVVRHQLPWTFDDLNNQTSFDESIRTQIHRAIHLLREELDHLGLQAGSIEYQERLAVGLLHLVSTPEQQIVQKSPDVFDRLTAELGRLGLEEFRKYLRAEGGLGIQPDNSQEYSALEALQARKGNCTEVSQILYGALLMAGLTPSIVEVDLAKTEEPELKARWQEIARQIDTYGHVCVGVAVGPRMRLLDPTLGPSSDARHRGYYPMALREYLAGHLSDRSFALWKKGERTRAYAELATAEQVDPSAAVIYLNRGKFLKEEGREEEALVQYEKAIRLDPKLGYAYNNRCFLLIQRGKTDDALRDCDKAIELNPLFVNALLNRCQIWEMRHQWEKMKEDSEQAIKGDSNRATAHLNRGVAQANTDRLDEAIADFQEAMRLEENSKVTDLARMNLVTALRIRGEHYTSVGKFDEATNDFSQAISLDKAVPRLYLSRGIVWAKKGDWGRMAADFTTLLQLAPGAKKPLMENLLLVDPRGNDQWDRLRAMFHEGTSSSEIVALYPLIMVEGWVWSAGQHELARARLVELLERLKAQTGQIPLSPATRAFLQWCWQQLPLPLQQAVPLNGP